MSTAFISEWAAFTDSPVAVAGATPNYGGPKDWVQIWADEKLGAVTMTSVIAHDRAAPPKNWATQVAVTRANDNALLTQNNAANQLGGDALYQGPKRVGAPASVGSLTWNGFAWVGNPANISSETFESFGGEQ